jgi:hypothetical protein
VRPEEIGTNHGHRFAMVERAGTASGPVKGFSHHRSMVALNANTALEEHLALGGSPAALPRQAGSGKLGHCGILPDDPA